DRDGQPVIVLRVRPSKQPPPVLVLQATAFRSYLRLPNLFLPCSMALQPPLRRDVVRKLLADDPAVITWLYPHGDGRFTPETVPDSAFRPLSDWIDYVLEHDRQALELWVQSTQFDFESFICADDQPARPPKPPADHRRAADRDKPPVVEPAREQPQKEVPTVLSAKPHRPEEDLEDDFFEAPRGEPSVQEKQRQLRELEERFKSLEGPLDSKERRALWPELAIRNADVGNTDEAGLCWMNALWLTERAPARWLWAWFRTEARAVPARVEKGESRPRSWAEVPPLPPGKAIDLSGADLDRLLALPDPSTADLRTLSAYLTWAAHRSPPPAPVVQRLNRLRLLLEKHEDLLPVRAAWLAWVSLARLSGGDVLILARARDRLLERLFRSGLEPRLDLPSFLRFAGQPTGPRFHAMRDWLPRLRELAQRWLRRQPPPVIYSDYREPRTAQYIDLMFAFALAKVGDVEASRRLLDQAKAVLGEDGHQAHEFLLEAFAYRIHQAQEGKPPGGPLPAEQMEYLALLAKQYEEVKEKNSYSPHYIIDRMRWLSRILEPDQRVDPYREIKGRASDLDRALARLPDILDRAELAERITRLLDRPPQGTDPRQARARILKVGLEQAARVGEEFAVALLDRTLPAFDALPPPRDAYQFEQHATLLEKGIFLAAHFDQPTYVQQLVARFERLLEAQGVDVIQSLDSLAAQCFRGLRKLGMRDVIDRLLRKMAERILEGQELKSLTVEWAASHPEALQALLHVAGGWFYFERDGQAEFILRVARKLLFDNKLEVKRKTRLACVYASTLGQAKVAVAQRGLEELFQKLEGIRDGFGTNKYYGWHQLQIVEAVVLAVVSDDFMMGADARRWLDDDEFLVRRRIHHDLRTMMAHSG
ncbi:MAG TPA: hypothetical protein VNK04_11175, partial [Gemmataceae bacterium]|nr:hypothetical protein [Gemmataceae bacterium]